VTPRDAGDSAVSSVAVVADDEIGRAFSIAEVIARAGGEVYVVSTEEPRRPPARLNVISPEPVDVEVWPPFLTPSYRLYRTLRSRSFDAIVFGDRGGHAYCTARAKQLGLQFEATSIVVHCSAPTLWAAERDRRAFLSKRVLGTGITERLALELADAFVCDDAALLAWFERQEWKLPQRLDSVEQAGTWRPPAGARTSAGRPLITVVVTYHERTTYLPFCLEGLARQTYPSLEVILVDDGSVSSSAAEQLAELEAQSWPWPFRVLRVSHRGLGPARNAGWESAAGEHVVFIDDDDIPFDGLIDTLWRGHTCSGVDVIVAGARFFRGDAGPTAHAGDAVRISLCEPRELGILSNQYGGPVCLWPRRLLERIGGFRNIPLEAWDVLLRARLEGASISTPPDPLYWYRQTPGGMFSVDPLAHRDEALTRITSTFGESLPDGARLLPLLAAGAYDELERRGRAARPRRGLLLDRGRLLLRRARHVREEEGMTAVARRALRLARRRR
jgi:hypothetical protein